MNKLDTVIVFLNFFSVEKENFMEKNYKIKVLEAKKDSDLLFKIVEHENEVFGEAKFERNGYARILLKYVLKFLKELGIKKVELTLDKDNFTAKRIYEELGFKIVGNLDNEYGDNVERYLMRYFEK